MHTGCCYHTSFITLTSEPDVPPSGDPDISAGAENAVGRRQANRNDEVGEGDGGGEPQQADVVVEGVIVVVRVTDDLGHAFGHLVGVDGQLSQPAQVDHQV